MPTQAIPSTPQDDQFRRGIYVALGLHVLLAAAFLLTAFFLDHTSNRWGESASSVGSIQASMVSAIPLPQKAAPVDKAVLTPEHVSPAPLPPPKEEAAPPPRPTDIEIQRKSAPKKIAPIETPAPPKHPQPTPPTAKAATGESATQLPQSVTQLKNGTATITVMDRTFGDRYAYYINIVDQKVTQSWYSNEADPNASQGKRVTISFNIERDGTPSNVRVFTASGSPSLDTSALRALQRIETFGPLPTGNQITVEFTFDYHRQ
jgi:periplasmic protein TonB